MYLLISGRGKRHKESGSSSLLGWSWGHMIPMLYDGATGGKHRLSDWRPHWNCGEL